MFNHEQYLVESEENRYLYRFPNGYGASVEQSPFTLGGLHGLWEVKLLYHDETVRDTHGMPFVFGYNLPSEVIGLLTQIEMIPKSWVPKSKKNLLRLTDYFRR